MKVCKYCTKNCKKNSYIKNKHLIIYAFSKSKFLKLQRKTILRLVQLLKKKVQFKLKFAKKNAST